ncbi:MAG: signal recognition particle-docking protein FtsY [Nanoarchaeota archaeon]
MFEKFKEKLKKSLSIFSKKAEVEAVEKTETVVKEVEVNEKEAQKNIKTETELKKAEKKEIKKEKTIPEKKEVKEIKKEVVSDKKEIKEKIKEVKPIKKETKVEKEQEEKREIKETKKEFPELKKEIKTPAEPIKEESTEQILTKKESKKEKEEPFLEPELEKPKKSFFGKLKESFTTKTISAEKFEELFWELELALLENNVSVEVIDRIKTDLKKELVDQPLPRDVPKKIEETLKRTLSEILTIDQINLVKKIKQKGKPYIIAFFGINGTGKTTTIAKLTHYLQQQKLSVVLAACDTFRAAAIQQLEEHADKLKVKIIKHEYGSDAAAVAFDAIKFAEKNKIDVVMIDTAGRLHSNANLMAELEKIIRVTKPDLKLFVGESITGNDCIEQARIFNELVEMDGAILTKADVDEKGGAPLSIAYVIKKPILFLGVGQRYEDLEEFNPEVILKRLGF